MKKLFLLLFTIATCQLTFAQDSTTILNNIGDSYFIDQYNSGDSLATTAIENSNAVQNIWLPDDSSGAIPTDIYYVGGVNKIYVYGKRNIIVIDASTNEKLARIPVSGFSQYYPTIENTQYLNYNHFAYNPKNGLLYCILEDASVIAINTANDSWQVVIPTLLVCGNNEYYNYFIKYDERLNRIYFVVSSSATNELFVYRTSDYSSVGDIAFVDPPENIRGLEINKYENEFYLSINKRFVRYTYDPDDIISETTVTKTTIGSYNQENKAGNMLYVYNEENNLNKLFCFPNRYNSSGTSNYYILDIDDKTHRLYYGGGGHSCINTFQLSTFYQIALRYPYTWLSVPRHLRTTSPQLTPTSTVFAQENITNGYNHLQLAFNKINAESGPPYPNGLVYATWDASNPQWQYSDNLMENVHSARGYKLEIHQSNPPQGLPDFFYMKGTVQDPFTKMDLYCHEDNWIGYFLYEEQNVFDALADIEPDIYHIMAQDFVCYRYHYPISEDCNSKSTNDYPPGTWICDNTPNIKFGDMIIVKPDRDISNFQWNFAGNPPSTFNRPDVVYYSFDEKASYSTFVMELDTTTDNPQEIGAFVNDTCVGACSVVEQDSVVVLKAYLSQQPGDSVVFEEHYVSKSTNNYRISDYYVLNPDNKIKEKRVIKTGEDRDIFIISFGNSNKKEQNSLADLTLNIFPNPASGAVTIEYITEREGTVKIVIFNSMGKMVKSFSIRQQNKGSHTMKWNVTGENGKKLKSGLYLVSLSFQDQTVSKKIVLNN